MSLEQSYLSPQCQAPPALKEQQGKVLHVTEYLLHVLALGLVMAVLLVLTVAQQLPQKGELFFEVLGFFLADDVFSLLSWHSTAAHI